MTTIYNPVLSHYKIEIDRLGYYTVTRPRAGKRFFDENAYESKYLQFQSDVEPFKVALKDAPFILANERHQAYIDLINSQFE